MPRRTRRVRSKHTGDDEDDVPVRQPDAALQLAFDVLLQLITKSESVGFAATAEGKDAKRTLDAVAKRLLAFNERCRQRIDADRTTVLADVLTVIYREVSAKRATDEEQKHYISEVFREAGVELTEPHLRKLLMSPAKIAAARGPDEAARQALDRVLGVSAKQIWNRKKSARLFTGRAPGRGVFFGTEGPPLKTLKASDREAKRGAGAAPLMDHLLALAMRSLTED